jgi:hypothetical protein
MTCLRHNCFAMNKLIALMLAAGALILAGCDSTNRTLELKNGRLTMTEERGGGRTLNWELKEVSSSAEMSGLRKAGWKRAGTLHHEGAPDTYLMKRKLVLQPVVPPPPFHPMLMTVYSTQTSNDGTWRIGVLATSVEVARFSGLTGDDFPGRSKVSFSSLTTPWTTRAGWFVFAENTNRVWSYDGDRMLLLQTCNDGIWSRQTWIGAGWVSYAGNYPCAVPAEVFSRLSKSAQKHIQSHE